MKTKTLFVTALSATLFALAPAASFASCAIHKSQQAGNETSVGGTTLAGAEGTGIEEKVLVGNETAVGGSKLAGGEGTGVEGPAIVGNETSVGGTNLADNEAPSTAIKLGN